MMMIMKNIIIAVVSPYNKWSSSHKVYMKHHMLDP